MGSEMSEYTAQAESGGRKGRKPQIFGTMQPEAMMELAAVYGHGSEKYAPYNFRRGYPWSWSFDAMMRHLWLFWGGEDWDRDSGRHHMAHAAWHALNLLQYSLEEDLVFDDRPSGPAADYGEQD